MLDRRTVLFMGVAAASPVVFRSLPVRAQDPLHGIAMHGDPEYPAGFSHFDYVNPDAPKAGHVRYSAQGTFDSFNPFIIKGTPSAGIGLIYDTLMTDGADEPFTEYGHIAESVELPDDRSHVRFNLRPEARWHDGEPLTVEDVIWTFNILREKGNPFYRQYYANVTKVEATGDRQVTFTFDGSNNRELPLILGQLMVLPRHYYDGVPFEETSLKPPLGSGPYKVKSFEAGRFIEYERVEDYWGTDLPVNRGRNNFNSIRYDYYRDRDVMLEAFKSGEFDFFAENSAKRWATGYDIPQIADGRIVREEIPDHSSSRMQGFVFNLRRPVFQDVRVREAIGYAFDFEWMNKNLFYGQYKRINSYFSGSETFAARELPGAMELAILEPWRDRLPAEVFTKVFEPPATDGSGNNRRQLRDALNMLKEAGYELADGVMTHGGTGQKLEFEYLYYDPSSERIAAPYAQSLDKIGVKMTLRRVDTSQYVERLQNFDFDMTTSVWGQSLSPGNEQREFWGSEAADQPGSRNLIGIKDPVIDAIVNKVIEAGSAEELAAACRALDRVLTWQYFVVPQFYNDVDRIAYWAYLVRPETVPLRGLDLNCWWFDEEKAAQIKAR
ncbi:MAG: ABC transporter substrate-binding protein [Geminicoccaceae bacterium]|nr:ABC transporter substrate-binding protein [Geminicoccaceae bacterium]